MSRITLAATKGNWDLCLGLHLTNEILNFLWSHHIQSQGLQVPKMLLDDWVLETFTPA